jgi:hypothetical protein
MGRKQSPKGVQGGTEAAACGADREPEPSLTPTPGLNEFYKLTLTTPKTGVSTDVHFFFDHTRAATLANSMLDQDITQVEFLGGLLVINAVDRGGFKTPATAKITKN